MTWPLCYSLIRLPLDTEELSATMESKFRSHVAAKALIAQFRALPPRAVCRTCGGVGERVSLSRCTPTPCPCCRPGAFAEFLAAEAYEREVLAPFLVAEGYGPELLGQPDRSGYTDEDPWELDADELNETAPLPREVPQHWGRERDEYDPADSREDIQPFTRQEKP